MNKIFKYFLIGLTSLTLLMGAPALTYVLADDGNTEYLGSEPLPGYGDDGNTEYLGSEPLPQAPSGGDFSYRYPECDWDSHQVYEVYQDSAGNYDRRNYQTQPGQCGASTPVSQPASPQGGDFSYRYPECDWDAKQVREVWQDSAGNYQYRNIHTQPGQCGASTTVSAPPPAAPAGNTNANLNANANQNSNVTNVTNNIVNQNQNTSNSTSSSSSNSTATVTVNQPQDTIVRFATFATFDCPSGTNKKVSGNEVICEIGQPIRVEVAGVTQTQAKELPKTGLPLLAWAAGAFIPAGLGLKRFGRGISFDMESNANFLWEERQYKVG